VGWHTVVELAREHEVHALVDQNCEAKVHQKFDPSAHPRIHLHFVSVPLLSSLVGRSTSTALWLIYYYLWQFAAMAQAWRLHRQLRFDGAQHVTFVKYNVPSLSSLLIQRPFIFGPVGGAERAPLVFFGEFGWKVRLAEAARVALQKLACFDPALRLSVARSELAVGVTAQTTLALRQLGACHVKTLAAVALSEDEIIQIDQACAVKSAPRAELTVLFVGRLIAWKGVHLGLRALAQSASTNLHFRIIGDGPMRGFLEAEAQRLGIASRVTFAGVLPRSEVLQAYAQADGLLYPSLHDSGGNAVLEAMAASLPILCLAFGGPDHIVADDCGWKVAASTPDEAVCGLASALDGFAANAAERTARGAAARARCLAEFTWAKRGEQLRQLWADLVRQA
jgi:glycosyltransferase involved in cell wall biosynthesis